LGRIFYRVENSYFAYRAVVETGNRLDGKSGSAVNSFGRNAGQAPFAFLGSLNIPATGPLAGMANLVIIRIIGFSQRVRKYKTASAVTEKCRILQQVSHPAGKKIGLNMGIANVYDIYLPAASFP
jgi:hypothetical protein